MATPFSTSELLAGQGIYRQVEKLGHSAEWHEETARINLADADESDKKIAAEQEKAKTATNPIAQKLHASNISQYRADAAQSRSVAQFHLDRAKEIRQSGGKQDDFHNALENLKTGFINTFYPREVPADRYTPELGGRPAPPEGKGQVGDKPGHKFHGNQHTGAV
jgi:hypothetical protein